MNTYTIGAIAFVVLYIIPTIVTWKWWDYDGLHEAERKGWAFAPFVNITGMFILTYERIQRGSEFGRLKQQLKRENYLRDLESLRMQVEKRRAARIKELEEALDKEIKVYKSGD